MANHLDLTVRTVVGSGHHSILIEDRGGSLRVKARGVPEFFIPKDVAADFAAALAGYARRSAVVRP